MSVHIEHADPVHNRIDRALWMRVLAHVRPYRHALAGLVVAGVAVAIIDSVLPLVTGRVIDAATGGRSDELIRGAGAYALLVAAMAALIWWFILMAGRTVTGFAHDVRRAAFAKLQELEFAFYDHHSVGWLMARLTSDTNRLSHIIPWTLLDAVWGSSLVLGISAMMLLLNWRLGLLVMMIIPPLAVLSLVFQRKLIRSQRAMRKVNSLLTASFNEGISGVRTSKALVREKASLREFQELSQAMYRHSTSNALQAAVYLPIVLTLGSVGVGLALWKGGGDIARNTGMSLGTLVAFMQYAALFYIPIQEMAARFTEVQAAQASAERLQGLLDTEPAIVDAPDIIRGEKTRRQQGLRPADADERLRTIEFRDVTFAYKSEEPVLAHFDLTVEAGETIALVGETGSGKTTIVSLLCRFYEPTSGSLLLNGVDYRRRTLAWLQSRLGIVQQDPHLFSGSIRANIRYGRLDASNEDIERAARLANAHDFVMAFENGYETEVGEGGSRLSTGQRQLVTLARAILADPEILVMDEATSSVDTETERLIQDAIETVLRGRTSFIIAHRLSTVRSADRILVIDRGRIIEEGNHRELLALGGRYAWLYTNQFARESEALGADRRG